jgi:hypothetical protein
MPCSVPHYVSLHDTYNTILVIWEVGGVTESFRVVALEVSEMQYVIKYPLYI